MCSNILVDNVNDAAIDLEPACSSPFSRREHIVVHFEKKRKRSQDVTAVPTHELN